MRNASFNGYSSLKSTVSSFFNIGTSFVRYVVTSSDRSRIVPYEVATKVTLFMRVHAMGNNRDPSKNKNRSGIQHGLAYDLHQH